MYTLLFIPQKPLKTFVLRGFRKGFCEHDTYIRSVCIQIWSCKYDAKDMQLNRQWNTVLRSE
jgi:hypothetical protein